MVFKKKSKRGGLHTKHPPVEQDVIQPHDTPQYHTQPSHIPGLPEQNPSSSSQICAPVLYSVHAEHTAHTNFCAPIADDKTLHSMEINIKNYSNQTSIQCGIAHLQSNIAHNPLSLSSNHRTQGCKQKSTNSKLLSRVNTL